MPKFLPPAATVALLLAAGPALAAPAAWTVDTTGGTSASVPNASGRLVLIVGCAGTNLALGLSGSGVDIDTKGSFAVTIDKAEFTLSPGKARNAMLLNNRTDGAAGIDDKLTAALRTGHTVTLSGTGFGSADPKDLSFPLAGSGAALKTVAAACTAPAVTQ